LTYKGQTARALPYEPRVKLDERCW